MGHQMTDQFIAAYFAGFTVTFFAILIRKALKL
jgi:hypothetical protein